MTPPLRIGTNTNWGTIQAVGFSNGERWYMMIDKHKVVSLMPEDCVEARPASPAPSEDAERSANK